MRAMVIRNATQPCVGACKSMCRLAADGHMDTTLVAVSPDLKVTKNRSRSTLVANRIMFKDVMNYCA
jgi:hypothetical protein